MQEQLTCPTRNINVPQKLCMFISIQRCLKLNSLWYIVKENPNQRLPINALVQICSMEIISKQCFYVTNLLKIIICLSCLAFLSTQNREHLFENILNVLDVKNM